MRVYPKTDGPWVCGHWNGSPLEIIMAKGLRAVPADEANRYHAYHEYSIILGDGGILVVEEHEIPLKADTVVMVSPGERHRLTRGDPDAGLRWIVVKERSAPDGKILVRNGGDAGGAIPEGWIDRYARRWRGDVAARARRRRSPHLASRAGNTGRAIAHKDERGMAHPRGGWRGRARHRRMTRLARIGCG